MSPSRRHPRTLVGALGLVLSLAACGGSDGSFVDAGAPSAPAERWTFTDDRGETVDLPAAPETIAADAASAGGLWEYGIDVDGGVFGQIRFDDGTAGPAIGLADPDDFESVGDATTIDLEALAAQRPEVIVAAMWSEDEFYGIASEQLDEVEQIAPIIGIRVDHRQVTGPLARIAELAESIDPAAKDAVATAKATFDASSEAFSEANDAQPDLLSIAASGSSSEMYVAYPPAWPDLSYYQALGLNMVEPEEHSTAGGFWETLSWEEAGKYPADLLLADARGGTLEQIRDQIPATALSLPVVEADQIVAWPAVHAYGYGNVAQILDDLTAAVEAADPTVGGPGR